MEGTLVSGLIANVESESFAEIGVLGGLRSEASVLETQSALNQPIVAGHVDDQKPFGESGGIVLVQQVAAESHEGRSIFRRQDTERAVKAVAKIVARGDGFSFGGTRSGGELRVGAIGFQPGLRRRTGLVRGLAADLVLDGRRRLGGLVQALVWTGGLASQFACFVFLCATKLTCCHARSFG